MRRVTTRSSTALWATGSPRSSRSRNRTTPTGRYRPKPGFGYDGRKPFRSQGWRSPSPQLRSDGSCDEFRSHHRSQLVIPVTSNSTVGLGSHRNARVRQEVHDMPDRIGTREEWQAARDELTKLEAQAAERNEEIKKKRLELPW